jgi:hypothetical protein
LVISFSSLSRESPVGAKRIRPESGERKIRRMASLSGSGCLSCGAEIVYLPAAEPVSCAGCGATAESRARCAAGHFFCDGCHAGDAGDAVERICASAEEVDPVAIALQAMRHPAVKMHGPEHHFLVPAALLAAWSNARGEGGQRPGRVAEARRRARPLAGGMCGTQGACGAAVGTGIFASIALGATPLSADEWRRAQLVTSRTLRVVAESGGPRCCKRDGWLAILEGARFAREELGVALPVQGPSCDFSDLNRQCIGDACPFHRPPAGPPGPDAWTAP